MDKVLSIFSLSSVIWSNIVLFLVLDREYFKGLPGTVENFRMLICMYLIYFIVFIFNLFVRFYCRKVQSKGQTSKIPLVISMVGTYLYSIVGFFILFGVSCVSITGGS